MENSNRKTCDTPQPGRSDDPDNLPDTEKLNVQCYTYLSRKLGPRKLTIIPKNNDETESIKCVVNWIDLANYTIDIALFSVYHKKIVLQLIKASTRGVRCRVLLYFHTLQGEKKDKHRRYTDMMLRAGVSVRWLEAELTPKPAYRIFMLDCSDPEGRPAKFANECAVISGLQPINLTPHHRISNEMTNLVLTKEAAMHRFNWLSIFETMWVSVEAAADFRGSTYEMNRLLHRSRPNITRPR